MGNYYQNNVDISGFASPFYDLARYTSAAINSKFTGMGLLTTKDTTVLSRYGSYPTNSTLGYAEAGVNYSFVCMDLHRLLTGPGSLSSRYDTLPQSGSLFNILGYTAVIYLIIVGRGGAGGTDPTYDGVAGWTPYGAAGGGGSGYYNWMRVVLQPGDSVSYTATQDANGIVTLSITTTVAAGSLAYVEIYSSAVTYRHEPGTVSRSMTAAAGSAGQVNAGGQGLRRGGDHNNPGGAVQAGTIAIDMTSAPAGDIPGGLSVSGVSGVPAGGGGGAPFCSAPFGASDGFQGGRGAYWTTAGDPYKLPTGVDATSGGGPGAGGGGNVNKLHNSGYVYRAAAPGRGGGLYIYSMIA